MIFDFEHHYIPEKLARKQNLISDKVTFVESGGIRRITVHAKLYDMEAQLRNMDEAGVDVSVLSRRRSRVRVSSSPPQISRV
ncbi:hypothetical protein ACFL0M_15315 [Thermodesulfobacteriota bacterium]